MSTCKQTSRRALLRFDDSFRKRYPNKREQERLCKVKPWLPWLSHCSAPVLTVDTAFLWTDNSPNTFFSKIFFAVKQTLDSLNAFNAGVAG